MAITVISAGTTANGNTSAVTVTEARCYNVQVDTQGASVALEGSVDGTTFFRMTPASVTSASGSATLAQNFIDQPVQKMRLNVTSYVSGTITASVSAV